MGVSGVGEITLGSITQFFPSDVIDRILEDTARQSKRKRRLPAAMMVYYIIALGLYMSEGCRSVLRRVAKSRRRWLDGLDDVCSESAITQARTRLGSEPIQRLYAQIVRPLATKETPNAWYREWRVVSLDGTTLDVADSAENEREFGRPGVSHGHAAYPQIRLLTLMENPTHVMFAAAMSGIKTGEPRLVQQVISQLPFDSLCLADRGVFSYENWLTGLRSGAALVWRAKNNMVLPRLKVFADRSYLSKLYPSPKDRKHDRNGVEVRVIEFHVGPVATQELYRLVTSIIDPEKAPAIELAKLYGTRWTIETSFAELKTHLRGSRIVLRSKKPELVKQEVYGLLLAHFGIRSIMVEAAEREQIEPAQLSFVHTLRLVHQHLPSFVSFPPSIRLATP